MWIKIQYFNYCKCLIYNYLQNEYYFKIKDFISENIFFTSKKKRNNAEKNKNVKKN